MDRGAWWGPWGHKESNMTEWLTHTPVILDWSLPEEPCVNLINSVNTHLQVRSHSELLGIRTYM